MVAFANYQSEHFHEAQEDLGPAKTAFVDFSYPWIKKNKVKDAKYSLEYIIMVRYTDKEGYSWTSRLGTDEDRYGYTVFNVQKGNADKYSEELKEMRDQKAAAADLEPPRTR